MLRWEGWGGEREDWKLEIRDFRRGINWLACEWERPAACCRDNYIAACRAASAALRFGFWIGDFGLGIGEGAARGQRPRLQRKGSAQLFLAGFSSRTVNVYGGPVEKLP